MSTRVVTVTPTMMDGTVVRWFNSLGAAEHPMMCGVLSASRHGVMGGGDYITKTDWEAAWSAHEQLARDENTDLKYLATHRKKGLMGPLECLHSGIRIEESTFTSATVTTRCMTCQAVLDERDVTPLDRTIRDAPTAAIAGGAA